MRLTALGSGEKTKMQLKCLITKKELDEIINFHLLFNKKEI